MALRWHAYSCRLFAWAMSAANRQCSHQGKWNKEGTSWHVTDRVNRTNAQLDAQQDSAMSSDPAGSAMHNPSTSTGDPVGSAATPTGFPSSLANLPGISALLLTFECSRAHQPLLLGRHPWCSEFASLDGYSSVGSVCCLVLFCALGVCCLDLYRRCPSYGWPWCGVAPLHPGQ